MRWYAPECIYFGKFTTRSDVWYVVCGTNMDHYFYYLCYFHCGSIACESGTAALSRLNCVTVTHILCALVFPFTTADGTYSTTLCIRLKELSIDSVDTLDTLAAFSPLGILEVTLIDNSFLVRVLIRSVYAFFSLFAFSSFSLCLLSLFCSVSLSSLFLLSLSLFPFFSL